MLPSRKLNQLLDLKSKNNGRARNRTGVGTELKSALLQEPQRYVLPLHHVPDLLWPVMQYLLNYKC